MTSRDDQPGPDGRPGPDGQQPADPRWPHTERMPTAKAEGWDDDADWEDDDWEDEPLDPQAEARAHARRRWVRRLRAAFFALVVLVVLGIGVAAAGLQFSWWQWPQDPAPAADPLPCPTPTLTAAPVGEVAVNVYNATTRGGLAADVAQGLQERGFVVQAIDNDPLGSGAQEPALVRHGPPGLAAARTVAAQVPGAVLVADEARQDAVIDLVLGAGFEQLRPPEEAAALTEPAPVASPEGCVPAEPAPASPDAPAEPEAEPTTDATG